MKKPIQLLYDWLDKLGKEKDVRKRKAMLVRNEKARKVRKLQKMELN